VEPYILSISDRSWLKNRCWSGSLGKSKLKCTSIWVGDLISTRSNRWNASWHFK